MHLPLPKTVQQRLNCSARNQNETGVLLNSPLSACNVVTTNKLFENFYWIFKRNILY